MKERSILLETFLSTLLLALIVALIYIMGWSYAQYYFEHFQLGLLDLEIPTEYYMVYALTVIKHQWPLLMLLIPLSMIIKELKAESLKWELNLSTLHSSFALLITILLFFLVFRLGENTAQAVYQNDLNQKPNQVFPSFPNIEIHLLQKKPQTVLPENREQEIKHAQEILREKAMREGCYRLILRNKGSLYLLQTPYQKGNIPVEILEKNKIEKVLLLPKRYTCS